MEEENGGTVHADTEKYFCTLAVTGDNPTFQAIYLCNDCILDPDENADVKTDNLVEQQQSPLCVCQSCAMYCHDEVLGCTDVDFVGVGPSYCDCNRLGNCKLYQKSLQEADRLGILPLSPNDHRLRGESALPSSDYIREVFDIPVLQDEGDVNLASLLVSQARELIRHTKETHWVDETLVGKMESQTNSLCLLETLAWNIYQSHKTHYRDRFFDDDNYGVEWWVQVKNIPITNLSSMDDNNNDSPLDTYVPTTTSSTSIDLHYDKDEVLAESFGIGSFPKLSTVTYLTALAETFKESKASASAAPTIVFDHTYDQGEDEVMSNMLVSWPRVGKHLLFDGRLLHGAPSHPSLMLSSSKLQASEDKIEDNNVVIDNVNNSNHDHIIPVNQEEQDIIDRKIMSKDKEKEPMFLRVTFLVNIWECRRRPAGVYELDHKVRGSIVNQTQSTIACGCDNIIEKGILLNKLPLPTISIAKEEDLPEICRHRIELPFVSNESLMTSDDNEEDEGGNTSVVTYPPPSGTTRDTFLVNFGKGMEAFLDYNYELNDDDNEDEASSEVKYSSILVQSDYI